jgi:hypothetical protein
MHTVSAHTGRKRVRLLRVQILNAIPSPLGNPCGLKKAQKQTAQQTLAL